MYKPFNFQIVCQYMQITESHHNEILDKILTVTEWDATIPLTINYLFNRFMIGVGRLTETAIDQTYMECLYKIPLSLIAITPNITSNFEKYVTFVNQEIDTLTSEETKLFTQRIQRTESTIAAIYSYLNVTFIRETLGNLTEEYRVRSKVNHDRFEAIYKIHDQFLNTEFDRDADKIAQLAENKIRFHFIDFPSIQTTLIASVDEMKAKGNTTVEMLEHVWTMATGELFFRMAEVKAQISMEVDRMNGISSGEMIDVVNPKKSDDIEMIVKESFEALDKKAFEFSTFQQSFMEDVKRVYAMNVTLAESIYNPKVVREPEWAYKMAGLLVNRIAHKTFTRFYNLF